MFAIAISTSPISRLTESFKGDVSWLTWSGGVFGAVFIAVCILMIPKLGAATTLALIVVGQMIGSLIFDHFGLFGLTAQPATAMRLAGAACLVLGVVLIRA